jgi:hypothetical protein
VEVLIKKCIKCEEEKDLSDFYKNKRTKSGYYAFCKKCHCERTDNYSKTDKGKEVKRKERARDASNYAVRSGKIPSPKDQACSGCGCQAQEYHHHLGYAEENWLDVLPMCKKCHVQEHLTHTA